MDFVCTNWKFKTQSNVCKFSPTTKQIHNSFTLKIQFATLLLDTRKTSFRISKAVKKNCCAQKNPTK